MNRFTVKTKLLYTMGVAIVAGISLSAFLPSVFSSIQPISFSPAANFATGNFPISISVGDFNGDGKTDLAVASQSSHNVYIMLGNGDGSFSAAANYAVGSYPYSVAVGDFNGDGKLDLTTANSGSNNVSILLGNGDGTFAAATSFAVGMGPNGMAVGDFNGDGKLDLATANSGSNNVSILLGNGDGTFAVAEGYAAGNAPLSVAVGDFNRDGKLDLAVANFNAGTASNVSILLGNGNGTFSTVTNLDVGSAGPSYVTVGDFNGDGMPDLAVATINAGNALSPANVLVFLGNGDGTFGIPTDYAVDSFPVFIEPGDFDHDGNLDLAVTNFYSSNVSLLLGNGDGTFQAATNFAVEAGPNSAAIGDFNGDGKLDLAVANYNNNNVSILLNTTTICVGGNFTAATGFGTGFQPWSVAVGDFNRDGKPDLAVANHTLNSNVSIVLGNGDGTFGGGANYDAGFLPWSVAVGDFNGDGKPDLAVSSNTVSILVGNGDGTFVGAANYGAGTDRFSVVVGDFNGDGQPDLAVANQGSSTVDILLGNGDGTFVPTTNYYAAGPFSVAVGDFNRDGKLDLAVSDGTILLGNGDGTFGAAAGYGGGGNFIAVGDFNGDGKPDLAVANNSSNTVSIFLGNGDGTFGAGTGYGVGVYPWSVAVGDFNGDGKPDLAVANYNSSTVSILFGNGDGAFAAAKYYVVNGAWSVAVGDFNRDGKLDLAVTNQAGGGSVLLNSCQATTTTTTTSTTTTTTSTTSTTSTTTTIPNYPPSADSLMPVNIVTGPSVASSFTAVYSDPDGWQNISDASLSISGSTNVESVHYSPATNKFTLEGISGDCSPGQATTLSNAFLSLNCGASSAFGGGNTLFVTFNLTPQPPFSGTAHIMIIAVVDQAGASSNKTTGFWIVNRRPSADSVSPMNSVIAPGNVQIFTAVYSDPDGWENIAAANFYLAGNGGLHNEWLHYLSAPNVFTMLGTNDICSPGQAATLSNGFLTLDCSASSVSGSGTVLTVTFNVTPLSPSSGINYNIFTAASDHAGGSYAIFAGTWSDAIPEATVIGPEMTEVTYQPTSGGFDQTAAPLEFQAIAPDGITPVGGATIRFFGGGQVVALTSRNGLQQLGVGTPCDSPLIGAVPQNCLNPSHNTFFETTTDNRGLSPTDVYAVWALPPCRTDPTDPAQPGDDVEMTGTVTATIGVSSKTWTITITVIGGTAAQGCV